MLTTLALTVDLNDIKTYGLYAGIAVAIWMIMSGGDSKGILDRLKNLIPKSKNKAETNPESPPPDGFKERVSTILKACEDAPAEIALGYIKEGLSEIDVLRAEVKRLAGRKTNE